MYNSHLIHGTKPFYRHLDKNNIHIEEMETRSGKSRSTSGCQRRREPLCTWLMGAIGWLDESRIFLGWATGKSTLRREGASGFFGSGRWACDWTRKARRERERKGSGEKERPKSNVARFSGRRGSWKGAETICPHMLCSMDIGRKP